MRVLSALRPVLDDGLSLFKPIASTFQPERACWRSFQPNPVLSRKYSTRTPGTSKVVSLASARRHKDVIFSRRFHNVSQRRDSATETDTSTPPQGIPYADLTIGVPKETFSGEKRVAVTPQNVALLLKKGFGRVLIEKNAGLEAQFRDEIYQSAGATLVDQDAIWTESDIILKVRAPSMSESNNEVTRDRKSVV